MTITRAVRNGRTRLAAALAVATAAAGLLIAAALLLALIDRCRGRRARDEAVRTCLA